MSGLAFLHHWYEEVRKDNVLRVVDLLWWILAAILSPLYFLIFTAIWVKSLKDKVSNILNYKLVDKNRKKSKYIHGM